MFFVKEGILTCTVQQLQVGGFDHNLSYLVTSGADAVLIDPAGDLDIIRAALPENFQAKYILLTHGHPDHAGETEQVRKFFPAPVMGHPKCGVRGALPLADRDVLPLGDGDETIEVWYTPGHSRDSVCYLLDGDLGIFTGDTLFVDYVGFGKPDALFDSLSRLKKLPEWIKVFPGHDYGSKPVSTLGDEKRTNPYFRCETEAEFLEKMKDLK